MSNHLSMNLSSSEEEYSSDDDDIKEKIDSTTSINEGLSLNPKQVNGINKTEHENAHEEEEDDDEFDDIDWEDGGDDNDMYMEEQSKPINEKSTIVGEIYEGSNTKDFEDPKDKRQTIMKKKRSRKQYNKIPTNSKQIKELLRNIQRTHMLLLTSRSIFHSSFYMNDNIPSDIEDDIKGDGNWIYSNEILNVAYSLIPSEFTDDRSSSSAQRRGQQQNERTNHGIILPNKMILNKFCTWFFNYVNHGKTNWRNRIRQNIASGAPSSSSTSSSNMKRGHGRSGRRRKRNSSDVDDIIKDLGNSRNNKRTKSAPKQQQEEATNNKSMMNIEDHHSITESMKQNLLEIFVYLSCINDDNPNIHDVSLMKLSPLHKTLVLLCMTRLVLSCERNNSLFLQRIGFISYIIHLLLSKVNGLESTICQHY